MTADEIKALAEQLAHRLYGPGECVLPDIGLISQSETAITTLLAKLEIATQELKNIANADTVEWDDPTQYEDWAKSRARWALGKVEREKPHG
jgi:hypothetical protein